MFKPSKKMSTASKRCCSRNVEQPQELIQEIAEGAFYVHDPGIDSMPIDDVMEHCEIIGE